jgi:CheY-like chemotaxis protein
LQDYFLKLKRSIELDCRRLAAVHGTQIRLRRLQRHPPLIRARDTMARILIAEEEQNESLIQTLLRPKHELVVVTTMSQAATVLRDQVFDLIIIDLYFDESRMFDLMHLARSISKSADKPIICIGSRSGRMHRPVNDGLDFTVRALGAWMFLDVHNYNQTKDPRAAILRVIERCLIGAARKATHKARVDLQAQRDEIHRLRTNIENEEWSEEVEAQLVQLRHNLTALLLNLCDMNLGNIAQQELIDESRSQRDRVSPGVVMAEDSATRAERKQTLEELHRTVDEFRITEREEEAQKNRSRGKRTE